MKRILQKVGFVCRIRYGGRIKGMLRKYWYTIFGMQVGKNTYLPKLYVTWPHQLSIGNNCVLEHNIIFKFDGIWKNGPGIIIGNNTFIGSGCEFNITLSLQIGNYVNIATGCQFIDHDHGTSLKGLIGGQSGNQFPIMIGNDVWLGCNVIVLKGVVIGDGAIVGAGAVVTKSILSNEIWAGIPAKKIGERSYS